MKAGHNPLKSFFMWAHRWHEQEPEKAIRVEFQLGREALKERGIDSPEDYFAKRGDLTAYLCNEWVRFTTGSVDRTNTSRAEVLPIWLKVADGFREWAGNPAGLSLAPLDRGQIDVRQLEKQGVGVLLTAAVLCGKAEDLDMFLAYYKRVIVKLLPEPLFRKEVIRRSIA